MRPEAIATSIGSKHILLVLDNCEHVIKVAARMAEELVRAGPKVFVLCTSREPLRVEGEWVYQVQPLDVPAEDALTLEEVLRTGGETVSHARPRGPAAFSSGPERCRQPRCHLPTSGRHAIGHRVCGGPRRGTWGE